MLSSSITFATGVSASAAPIRSPAPAPASAAPAAAPAAASAAPAAPVPVAAAPAPAPAPVAAAPAIISKIKGKSGAPASKRSRALLRAAEERKADIRRAESDPSCAIFFAPNTRATNPLGKRALPVGNLMKVTPSNPRFGEKYYVEFRGFPTGEYVNTAVASPYFIPGSGSNVCMVPKMHHLFMVAAGTVGVFSEHMLNEVVVRAPGLPDQRFKYTIHHDTPSTFWGWDSFPNTVDEWVAHFGFAGQLTESRARTFRMLKSLNPELFAHLTIDDSLVVSVVQSQ
jgi:hypothetical protein